MAVSIKWGSFFGCTYNRSLPYCLGVHKRVPQFWKLSCSDCSMLAIGHLPVSVEDNSRWYIWWIFGQYSLALHEA